MMRSARDGVIDEAVPVIKRPNERAYREGITGTLQAPAGRRAAACR